MEVTLSKNLKEKFPAIKIGILEVRDVIHKSEDNLLNEEKKKLEAFIRENYSDVKNLKIIKSYNQFFKRFGSIYPIQYQIQSILKGGSLPSTFTVVEAMFMAELKTMYLTAGHDLDKIEGGLTILTTSGTEDYIKINKKTQQLKTGDIICQDAKGIISSVLYGPDYRSRIGENTKNCLFFSYFPYGEDDSSILNHFNTIINYLKISSDIEMKFSDIKIFQF